MYYDGKEERCGHDLDWDATASDEFMQVTVYARVNDVGALSLPAFLRSNLFGFEAGYDVPASGLAASESVCVERIGDLLLRVSHQTPSL